MPVDPMLWLAIAAFAWGMSLATYRWIAVYNGWPMGEWQAHRPGLPIAIGLFGVLFALAWTAMTRVAAQSALLLAPIAVILLLIFWMAAASHVPVADASLYRPETAPAYGPAATEREADRPERDRGITRSDPRGPSSPPR
jgi:hypothetical protein